MDFPSVRFTTSSSRKSTTLGMWFHTASNYANPAVVLLSGRSSLRSGTSELDYRYFTSALPRCRLLWPHHHGESDEENDDDWDIALNEEPESDREYGANEEPPLPGTPSAAS